MPTPDPAAGQRPARPWDVSARGRVTLDGLEHLVGGMGTAALALVALPLLAAVAVAGLTGVGLRLAPGGLRVLRAVANRERARLSRWGPQIIDPDPVPGDWRGAIRQPASGRELRWLLTHATLGLLLGVLGLTLPLRAALDLTFPLYWPLLPDSERAGAALEIWDAYDLRGAFLVSSLSLLWVALALLVIPVMARLQAWPGRRLLAADPGSDLALRVAQLAATRAAALDAHAAELRRIERSLHDGTQNRLVAVTVLLGATRRALARDPSNADAMLERAQQAAEQALAELRTVVRGILPPVLADRGLAGALAGLASDCGVDCKVDVDVPGRCAASVEATTYFVVAEALTNIAKHSRARHATVTVRRQGQELSLRIEDDGVGGVDENEGSGITGIRRRVEAHDGRLVLTSPPGGPTTLQVELPCGL
jgi:signal transduction histidine kinase